MLRPAQGNIVSARCCRETIPYQINSPRHRLYELLPAWPRATDVPSDGTNRLPKQRALQLRHIQPNPKNVISVLALDIDRAGGAFAWEDANVAAPNLIIGNPANGHAHIAHLLAVPVAAHAASRLAPLRKLAAIQRGMIRRTGADPAYCGNLIKNPFHIDWRVMWWAREPYTLSDLERWLDPEDTTPVYEPRQELGLGRNCTIFERLRRIAYKEVLIFNGADREFADFRHRLEQIAHDLNLDFEHPLPYSEIRHIGKSVARWTWKHFSPKRFSEIQRQRSLRRWANHQAAERNKPWATLGISRATYYRRRQGKGPRQG